MTFWIGEQVHEGLSGKPRLEEGINHPLGLTEYFFQPNTISAVTVADDSFYEVGIEDDWQDRPNQNSGYL